MFKKLMKRLTNNPSLKILSILIAVILWLVVVNYDNPEVTETYRIPVEVTNEKVLEEMGKVYEVVGDSNVATIYVTGKRKIIDGLNGSDFTATADLSQIDFREDGQELLVPIDISAKRYEKELNITRATVNMKITLEELSTEQSYISGTTSGTPAEGYAIGEVTVSPNLIKISGPQSIVSQVSRIEANVNVDGLTEDFTASVTPVLYDENGNVIESSQLRLSQDRVAVGVQILGTKTVPVECQTTGTPPDGYLFAGLEYAPESIVIKGEAAVLNNIQKITIPGEAINLDGAAGDVENSIDITPYLSELGVSLVDPENNKIAVKALVERLETRNMELPIGSLEVLNLPEEYEAAYSTSTVNIPVRGRNEDMSGLTLEQIKASVDLGGLQPGIHMVEVNVTVSDKFQVLGTVTLQIRIMEKGQETDDTPDGENDTEDGAGDRTGTDLPEGDDTGDEAGANNSPKNNNQGTTDGTEDNSELANDTEN